MNLTKWLNRSFDSKKYKDWQDYDARDPSYQDIWGWLPIQSVTISLGILLIAVACSASRASMEWAPYIFWIGYLLIISFPLIRLTNKNISRQEQIGTILLTGMAFYLIKVFYSPLAFSFNDEMQHWRSTYDTLKNQALFTYNSTLPVSSYFPGLESAANAFISLTSVSIFEAGIVIEGVARFLTLLSLFLLFEKVTQSSYIATIASLIYFAGPNFLLGDSQYTYEGVAISLTITGLLFAFRRVQMDESRNRLGLITVAILCFSAVIVTHHVTSYILAALISLWGISALMLRKLNEWKYGPVWFALLIGSGCIAWLALVGPIVIPYISVPVKNGLTQAIQVVLGEQQARTFFQSSDGDRPNILLQITSYLSVILLAGFLPLGAFQIWYRKTKNSLAPAMVIMAFGYYVSQVLRLSPSGFSLTNRLAGAVFLSLSCIVALGVSSFVSPQYLGKVWRLLLASIILLINTGSATAIINGRPLPGPYDVNIFSRRISKEGFQVADWASSVLGPEHRFGADYVNLLILGSYGRQNLVTDLSDKIFIEESIYATSEFGIPEKYILSLGKVDYLVLDTRIEVNKQVIGPLKPNAKTYQTRLDELTTIDRIFDGGHIMIFHLGFVENPKTETP